MSNFFTKAKKPGGDEFKKVEMIDNYFGSHEYGVRFPDGEVYREDECDIKKRVKPEKQEDLRSRIWSIVVGLHMAAYMDGKEGNGVDTSLVNRVQKELIDIVRENY